MERPRKRWRDQPHLEDQGTGNMPDPSGIWWWRRWWWWWKCHKMLIINYYKTMVVFRCWQLSPSHLIYCATNIYSGWNWILSCQCRHCALVTSNLPCIITSIRKVAVHLGFYRCADKLSARPDWKKQLKGRHFSSDAEVIAAAETWLDGQPSEFFLSDLQKSEFGRCSLFPSSSG